MERKTWLPLVLMLVFAASRWPGMLPQNFSAAHALLFCAAFWLPGWMGWVLPLATIIVTDILLNLFAYNMPVMVPELISGNAKVACSDAKIRSAESASSKPPPQQIPFTAAITGLFRPGNSCKPPNPPTP